MAHLAESLRLIALLLEPVMTHAPRAIFTQLGLDFDSTIGHKLVYGEFPAEVTVVAKGTPLFPRLDTTVEVDYIKTEMKRQQKVSQAQGLLKDGAPLADNKQMPAKQLNLTKAVINFDDFDKVELKAAEILNVEKVPKADRLLKFTLDAGDEGTRQIISGIAEFYPDFKRLIGKKVIAVTNLKPRKLRGELSQGMLLSAEHDGNVQLLTLPDSIVNGSLIG